MMSLEVIRQLSREQAAKARKEKKLPFPVDAQDIEDWKHKLKVSGLRFLTLPFPNIGDYRPKGYTLEESLFVDKSGMGADDEPALTIPKLLDRLVPGKAYAIIEEGQFQLRLGVFAMEPTQTRLPLEEPRG